MKEKTPDKTILFFGLILEPFEETNYGQWLICYLVSLLFFVNMVLKYTLSFKKSNEFKHLGVGDTRVGYSQGYGDIISKAPKS